MKTMAETQGATPPAWLGRPRWRLLLDVLGGVRANLDKLVQLAGLVGAYLRPSVLRRRFERLCALGHIDVVPTWAQAVLAGRDQMMLSASEETKLFYASQGIPWIFHNARRFLAGPATMLDPIGLFSPRDTIVEHVLQTFHRHPVYDLVLLRAHEGGVEALARALRSLIEDGSYHARLSQEIATFEADPLEPARPVPEGLVSDEHMMLGMDQFKDLRGFARYASRLDASVPRAVLAWLAAGFDEALGSALGVKLGPVRIHVEACDPEVIARHPAGVTATSGR